MGIARASWNLELQRVARIKDSLRLVWRAGKQWMLASIGVLLLQSVFPPIQLVLLKRIIDSVGGSIVSRTLANGFSHAALLVGYAAMTAIAEVIVRASGNLVAEAQGQVVADHIHQLLAGKSAEVELAYYEIPFYHDTFHRAQHEAPQRALHLTASLNQFLRSTATLLGMLILLLSFHGVIVLVLLGCALPTILIRARYAQELHRLHERGTSLERQASYYRSLLTTIEPAKEIRFFDLGGLFKERFNALRSSLRRDRLAIATRRAKMEIATQVLAELAIFGFLAWLAFEGVSGRVTPGSLVIYFWALQWGRALLTEMLSSASVVYEDNLFLTSLYKFLNLQLTLNEPEAPLPMPRPIRSGITFTHLCFRYPGTEEPVLEDINIDIRPGEKIALVGENGSGKTTLVKLLCRLYDPTGGDIRIDGIPLPSFESKALRREISVVFQDYMRYELTARENIWLGNIEESPDAASVEAAARRTGAHDIMMRLPYGYETRLGRRFEGGAELSVGEWQKMALARAFLRDSQIIVLDEPTSALDAEAESEVFQRFFELVANSTAILISHRLSTVRMADRIYVLERGRIVEKGTHDELIENRAQYARLFSLQAEPYR